MTSPMRPKNKNVLLKVVILGDGGVGKSCLMNRFMSNQFDENSFHTIGVEFLSKDIDIDGEKYTLQCWDTAGQERFKALRTPFYRGSDICLLTYAVNDRDSFRGLKHWREEFIKYADVDGDNFPFIVVGNKNDVPTNEREITSEEVLAWCQEFQVVSFIETSAKTSENVSAAFILAVREWKKFERITDMTDGEDAIDLTRSVHLNGRGKSSCCTGNRISHSRQTHEVLQ
ncbi:ras-related protein Rab-9B [Sitodiplosis mosellana]|uniref:ras-related protein Rab-9B n=1 Tax=Sitodiplosis mosellana TaxID=263140 RepID=UPI0024450762|nr:ras-related protein Rab-9B [Sitodiplosis mosellana]